MIRTLSRREMRSQATEGTPRQRAGSVAVYPLDLIGTITKGEREGTGTRQAPRAGEVHKGM